MDSPDFDVSKPLLDHRGARRHRYMESADINAAFREVFGPLRTNIRRGMGIHGQVYAIEMDASIPGEMLGAEWIPSLMRGVDDPALLVDAGRRRAMFDRLLAEPRAESLFVYVCEREAGQADASVLYVEIASADGRYAAEYPVRAGKGWHVRELLPAQHRRLDPVEQT